VRNRASSLRVQPVETRAKTANESVGLCFGSRNACYFARQEATQEPPGVRMRMARQLFGRSGSDNPSAGVAAFGAEIDHPVCFRNQLEIVLDHQDCMSAIHEALEHLDQAPHVGVVQADGRLFENEQIALLGRLPKGTAPSNRSAMGHQLDPLGLAAAERRAGLPSLR